MTLFFATRAGTPRRGHSQYRSPRLSALFARVSILNAPLSAGLQWGVLGNEAPLVEQVVIFSAHCPVFTETAANVCAWKEVSR